MPKPPLVLRTEGVNNPNQSVQDLHGTGGITISAAGDVVTINGSGAGGAVSSVFGRTGAVVAATNDYTQTQIAAGAIANGSTATTQAALDGSTKVATDAYADAGVLVEKNRALAAEALLAPIASPTFTGTPAAPTPTPLDSSTKIATTAFVAAAVAGGGAGAGVFQRLASTIFNGTNTSPIEYGDLSAVTGSSVAQIPTATLSAALGIFSTINNVCGIFGSLLYRTGRNIHMLMMAGPAGKITDERYWFGMTDQTLATQGASDNPAGNYAAFRFSTLAGDTVWQCITKDGTTQNVQSSLVAPAINTTQAFAIIFDDVNANVKFYINGTLVATSSSHLPSAATLLRYVATSECFASNTNNGCFFAMTRIASDF